jgi:hypothetical protein
MMPLIPSVSSGAFSSRLRHACSFFVCHDPGNFLDRSANATEPVCSCRPKSRLNPYYLLCAVCRSRFRPRAPRSFTMGWRLSSTGSIFCHRRRPVLFQYLLQHRRDCSGASELRRRPQDFVGACSLRVTRLVGVQEMTEAKPRDGHLTAHAEQSTTTSSAGGNPAVCIPICTSALPDLRLGGWYCTGRWRGKCKTGQGF